MTSKPPPQIKRVTEQQIQKIFNEHYLDDITAGKIVETVMENRHPSLIAANEPYCTKSQMVSYRNPTTNEELARAHRYVRPNGSIGASGKPDPKRVLFDGIWYRIIKKKNK
jgi:hypothetical protein